MSMIRLLLLAILFSSCDSQPGKNTSEKDASATQNNLQPQKEPLQVDTLVALPADTTGPAIPLNKETAGIHPISLQWISWDKKGEVQVSPLGEGWYSIQGSQENTEKDFLKIDGKIKRLSEKELLFEGKISTRVKYNNNGETCVKTGKQRFFAKGNRTYFRLQHMENCEGGSLVDYVDIYPGTSSL